MSMPSSSDAVATHTDASPSRSRRSDSNRRSRDSDPWCAATRSSPSRSDSRCATRSTSRRVFTNTSVDRCCSANFAMASSACAHCSCVAIGPSSLSGNSMARSIARRWPTSTMAQSGAPSAPPAPVRKRAISSMGRCVADRPTRVTACLELRQRRSTLMDRCEPRLLGATAWSSSRMSVRTPDSPRRPDSEVRRMKRDSGVVMRICGGRLALSARSFGGVSPVRTAARISAKGRPISRAVSAISASGSNRLWRTSLVSAFSGDT